MNDYGDNSNQTTELGLLWEDSSVYFNPVSSYEVILFETCCLFFSQLLYHSCWVTITLLRYNRVCISSSQEVFTTGCGSQFLEIVIYSTTSHREQLEEGGQTGTHGTGKHKNESTDPLYFCFICNCGINELLSVSLKDVERSRWSCDNVSTIQRWPDC